MVVRRLNPLAAVVRALGVAAFVAVVIATGFADLNPFFLLVGVVGAAGGAIRATQRASVRLRIDAFGVALPAARGRVAAVPWSSVRELVLTVSQPAGAAVGEPLTLAVRLTPDAPLPPGLSGRITTPGAPHEDEQLTARIGDLGLSAPALEAAVREHGGGRPLRVERIEGFRIGS